MISYSQRAIRRDADRHENQLAPLSALDDRDQTGLETALHDPERTELSSTAEALQSSWSKRLEELSRRTVTSSVSSLDGEAAQSIHHHLDALERILRTPNTDFVQRNEWSRHESGGLESVDSDMSQLESVEQVPEKIFQNVATMSDQKDDVKKKDVQLQLNSVMTEVTALNKEINKRRNESNEIKDLFEERCRGLTRTVAELEDELLELQGDLLEDSIELEGIQGTVRGLEDWIDGLRETQKATRLAHDRSRQEARRRWVIRRTSQDVGVEMDAEIVLDGLMAWMRGWQDVEEGFRIRSQARQARREKRLEQLSRPNQKIRGNLNIEMS